MVKKLALFLFTTLYPFTHLGAAEEGHLRLQRLCAAGKLWLQLGWIHPNLEGAPHWERALVDALPAIDVAHTTEERRAAIVRLLDPLQDPLIRILGPGEPDQPPAPPLRNPGPQVAWLEGNIAVFGLHDDLSRWSPQFIPVLAACREALPLARALVFDLRPAHGWGGSVDTLLEHLLPAALPADITLPCLRYRRHTGPVPAEFPSSGGFHSGWSTLGAPVLRSAPGSRPVPMAFIINGVTPVPPVALALQKAGLAFLVAVGPMDPAQVVPTEWMDLGEGLRVRYQAGELVFPDGTTGFQPDLSLPTETGSVLVDTLELLGSGGKPGSEVPWKQARSVPVQGMRERWKGPALPDLQWRRLAVFRFWGIVNAFHPYLDLLEQPWEDILPEALRAMEAVKAPAGYLEILCRMAAALKDNHAFASQPTLYGALFGSAGTTLGLRVVEGRVVVEDPGNAEGIHPWEELLEVDGVPVQNLMARLDPLVASANPWSRARNLAALVDRGSEGRSAHVRIRGADGRARNVTVPRSAEACPARSSRTGEVMRLLTGGVAYADLDRLELSQMDALMDLLGGARALILDLRGYPRGTAWALAPRLNVRGAKTGPLFHRRILTGNIPGQEFKESFRQTIPEAPPGCVPFRGKVIVLVDERTQSQAEHTVLLLEAVCDPVLVGSPTAGTNGDVTDVCLPGDVLAGFTGQGVCHSDGRRLQRLGLQPQILVHPTLAGLRAGRDEVLERALAMLHLADQSALRFFPGHHGRPGPK